MASLFPQFQRLEVVYKTTNETPFPAAVLIPKSLKPSEKPSPLLVHFHGGGLYMGTYLEPAFISKWFASPMRSGGYYATVLTSTLSGLWSLCNLKGQYLCLQHIASSQRPTAPTSLMTSLISGNGCDPSRGITLG